VADLSLELVLSATGGRLAAVGRRLREVRPRRTGVHEPRPHRAAAPAFFRGVSTDTRSLAPGALFVALRGERFDGHDFVAEAFTRGAAGALVSTEVDAAGPLVIVPDTLLALGALAAAHRAALSPKVIAITGSTGKTTTKEMIAAILCQGWRTARTPGNYNNEIGVPLALLELDGTYQAAVIELAMRGRGQITQLARMARPQVGVITNVGLSHLELLGSREAIAEAKAELLTDLPEDGAAVLNADDAFFSLLVERSPCRVVSFGQRFDSAVAQARAPSSGALPASPDVAVDEVRVNADGSTEFRLRARWGEHHIALSVGGRHHALNAAAAAAAAIAAGADPAWVAPGLASFAGAEKRSRIVAAPAGFTVIDDSYNAAPDSMRAALELLADLPGNRKIAVLGDMRELGPMAAEWHREVGELAAEMGVTALVTVGELGRFIAAGARAGAAGADVMEASDNAAAAAAVAARAEPGDVVLVKGSRAMAMEEIVERLCSAGSQTCGQAGRG
jgi:UDP-N-acetylmuramoyl-tripeptide--D-alanyl-D-alanine ligase